MPPCRGARRDFYQLSAVNAIGEGDRSAEVSAETFDVPGQPRALNAWPSTNLHDIDLTWQPPEEDGGAPVTNYLVYRSTDTGGQGTYTLIAVTGPDTAYTDEDVPFGEYYYRVAALNVAGEGLWTNPTPTAGGFVTVHAEP